MTRDSWAGWVAGELEAVRSAGRWRELQVLDTVDGSAPYVVTADGAKLVNFGSNDYLGLSGHPLVTAAAIEALAVWGAGASASRLVTGTRPIHAELEAELADWRGTEGALVFPTGYQANLAVIATLGAGARIVSDAANHASIIDGCRLSRAEVCVYAHGAVDEAEEMVRSAPGRALVVSDTVFSMDGDVAPVAPLAAMCARWGALLVLDDAHAVLDLPRADPLPTESVVRVGTLSKGLGSLGGYVVASRQVIDLLVNRARPFIYTTALTPADSAAALAALRVWRSDEGRSLRAALRDNVDHLRPGHPSPVLPVVLGDEDSALAASAVLAGEGFWVPAIRPPSVEPGSSRLRIALSAAHTSSQVEALRMSLS
ncbi:MAG: aminotransferase class I/II-fold pyridoxal phosphate-dependent enzyme, partial [Acidimicrobiales bacterium]